MPRCARPELAFHEIEHRRHRLLRREIEVLVEAECEPCVVDPRDRRTQLEIAEIERQRAALERRLDRRPRHLAVALRAMAVAREEERAVDGDRKIEHRAGDELLAIDVAAPCARRPGRVLAGLGRRHPDDAEERRSVDRVRAAPPRLTVERPVEAVAVRPGRAPGTRRHLVDADDERLSGASAAHLERPGERVAASLGLVAQVVRRVPLPARVVRVEGDRPAGVDGFDGLVVAREEALHARGSWIHASGCAMSTRRPTRRPSSSRNSHSETACSSPRSSGANVAGT